MKEDLERFLMELEERLSWVAYELRERNYQNMLRQQKLSSLRISEMKKEKARKEEEEHETGLSFLRGDIVAYRRWQNSPAKHLDVKGHMGAVYACKLSKCHQYVISASSDKTVRLWKLSSPSGKCLLTWLGHTKRVTDCDLHPDFQVDSRDPYVISCSGDGTVRVWNTFHDRAVKVLKGHTEAVYKCAFSPDGQRIASCSEDMTVRTWSFPEGYTIFVYRAHASPVTAVKFSPSGRSD